MCDTVIHFLRVFCVPHFRFAEFLDRIGQFAVEFHVSRRWINSLDKIINIGKLYLLMEESGIELISAKIGDCHPDDEAPGMMSHDVILRAIYVLWWRHLQTRSAYIKYSTTVDL